ncbi:MAG: toll/interleukin-1 receptor domain-containing protein [Bacteroidales bacterium]|nr:toll/interleukin-1 receptor domain-containing protein [Bacteroidales bacterium]
MEKKIQSIYEEIAHNIQTKEGQCVLLLGPELSVNKNGTDYKTYFKKLAKTENQSISRYFESENLFSFKDDAGARDIRKKVKEFYSNVGDMVLLDMISRIKIPLIINVCPDIAINKIFDGKKKPNDETYSYTSGYFSKDTNHMFKDIPFPTNELPVIYNIFGNVEKNSTLILTHGKLYETMEHLLPEKSLPANIEYFLNGASSFIFLGFKFDSWYYQLICHKLKIKDPDKTILCTPDCGFNDTVSFIMRKHFKVDFTCENPAQAIERIIRECEKKPGSLRPKDPIGNYSLYISYARKNDDSNPVSREAIVDWLEKELGVNGDGLLQVFRDRSELTYGDSIDSFMNRIGKGKTVIRVVSDKYLKSRYCMDEALRIHKYIDTDKRVFTIVLSDVVADDVNNSSYKKFWKEKCESIFEEIDKNIKDTIHKEKVKRKYDIYLDIYSYIDSFIMELKDEVHLKVKYSDMVITENDQIEIANDKINEFSNFVETVINKMKEDK